MTFYDGLKKDKKSNLNFYQQMISEFKEKFEDMIAHKLSMRKQNKPKQFRLGGRRNDELKNKDKDLLLDAADLLFREVKHGKQEKKGDDDSFYNNQKSYDGDSFSQSESSSESEQKITELTNQEKKYEETEDNIKFNLADGSVVYFHNIKKNYYKRTMGFTKLSLRTLLSFIIIYIDSNISFIVGMLIILNQIVVGGVMNILISGIIFFCIIVEDSGSSLPYWDILNAIFFL